MPVRTTALQRLLPLGLGDSGDRAREDR